MWRGDGRSNISVAAPFVWRCLRREADAITHQTIRRQVLSIATDYDGLAKIVETINRQRGGC
jgi:hypothetical protein